MASEQLIKEELQNGGMASGVSALSSSHSQMDDDESTGTLERAAQLGVTNGEDEEADDDEHDQGESEGDEDEEEAEGGHDDGDFDHNDAEEYESDGAAEDDDDLEEDETLLPHSGRKQGSRVKHEDDDRDDDEEHDDMEDAEGESDVMEGDEGHDEDAEGESDDDLRHRHHEDDEEGVGAVKIRPGETDDEDDSEASAAASESSDDEWDETAEHAEDDDDDDEEEAEEGEEADEATCFYCKQGEQHDSPKPSKMFFSCLDCSEMAHQECASTHENPAHEDDCNELKLDEAAEGDEMEVDERSLLASANGTPSVLTSLKASTPKSSPALRGATANTESVSEDHTDTGSRSLRKRRTSPIESVDSGMSLRKRRKNATDDLSIDGFSDIRGAAVASSVRSLRIKPPKPSRVSVVKKSRTSLILKLKVRPKDLRRITVKKRKYTKRGTAVPKIGKREQKRLEKLAAENGIALDSSATPVPVMPSMTAYTQPFYSFFDKETEDQKGKPYGGILNEAEADTSKTFPTPDDRRRFDEAKQKAEDEWRARLLAMQTEAEAQQLLQPAAKRKKSTAGPASQIECIEFSGWEIDTWYAAPYPEEYSRNRVLYICEFCLKYMNSDYVAWRHKLKCPAKHPPGDEIYRHKSISFFEVDGRKNPVYCQNLCLLAKLFLGSKTLYYDVEPFLFYVLCEYDEFGYHFVGYFSKEKRASSQNNVSCILTLPIHQRKGYGNLLIDFSYLLTRVEEKTGSPEKPLSDMGLVSYRNYWRLIMCQYLLKAMREANGNNNNKLGLSVKKISDDTGMTADDVISALEGLRCLVRDPQTELYAFRVDVAYCQEYVAKWEAKKYVTLDEEALTWTPYVMGRGNATNFELGPALTAIAPREEDDEEDAAVQGTEEPKQKVDVANGDSAEHTNGVTRASPGADADADGEPDPSSVANSSEATGSGVGKPQTGEDVEMADGEADKDSTGPALQPVNGNAGPAGTAHSAGVKKEEHAASSSNGQSHSHAHGNATGDADDDSDWASAYESIPTTRFAVFPTVSARRLNNYPRGPIGRPPGARTGTAGTRSRRYTTGSSTSHVRRSVGATASPARAGATPKSTRPKAATSSSKKKKTGGTGRGPGRWPKGTKKSDYGNADSGPGLPPKDAEGEADPDTVQVHTPTSSRLVDKRNGLNGAVLESGSRGRSSPRLGKIKSAHKPQHDGDDTVMVDADE
ncbi:histone acetyltransferase [Ophiostoma piceae UAMH 11346]|uniref:Histone acetyltransferase n=1 Tax=Ophiostoma piceae (strain UAMH 11346) TaxID=1262450 RepID=S3BUL4_OPHP1|nr:histone acetyltransferase [Ophiostoma piceae UAMH 11346]